MSDAERLKHHIITLLAATNVLLQQRMFEPDLDLFHD